ncbi:hypothetical protein [Amycolatopsis orientalis]|uniref:hypothetical protein n=1 Tax=Amycolatopsis orientalis TaxID=31958 RepID=UPI000420DFF2|nr:hypothetical protein [Amycolatopsis orientalis]
MTVSGLERARQALRRGDVDALLGERECAWLDVKDGVYRLDQPKGADELAKDVTAFANTPHGGLLVVGFAARKEHGEEIIEVLNPVPRRLVNFDQYRQVIAARVLPALRDVTVEWIDCGNDAGVLVIDIPAQPRSSQLFAVPAPAGTAEVGKIAVAVPVRDGDGTRWLRPHEIRHFIGLGYANSGDGDDKLAALLAAIQAPRDEQPKYVVGGTDPRWSGVLRKAVSDLAEMRFVLGDPISDADSIGPGVAQHFREPGQQAGWVLCAQPRYRPVAVAEEIWQALREQGSGAPDSDALGALGFPSGVSAFVRIVGRDAQTVRLSGGRWGRGRLLRWPDPRGRDWRWEPHPTPSAMTSAATRSWTGSLNPPQLRARVLAILPFADAGDAKLTPSALDETLPLMPSSALGRFTTMLSSRRGGNLAPSAWVPGAHGNASDRLSQISSITAPDGEPALSAEVMMTLPLESHGSAVITCAEVRVENFDAWSKALNDPVTDLRWSVDELVEFMGAAWVTAAEMLPQLIEAVGPELMTPSFWGGVPRMELSISAESPHSHEPGRQLLLADVLDLDPLGHSDRRDQLTELFVSVPSAPGLNPDSRRRLIRSVLVAMARSYGFMHVQENVF